MSLLHADLIEFLKLNTENLNTDAIHAGQVVSELGRAGVFRIGVPESHGGIGGSTSDTINAIGAVSEYSLAAGFVFWGQRAFIEYLIQSPNAALQKTWLPKLLSGEYAGATGLSNAMKFLSSIESLGITATTICDSLDGNGVFNLNGIAPWATNLPTSGFIVALAVERQDGGDPFIVAIPSDKTGLNRSPDHDLIALRGTNTAALKINDVTIDETDIIALHARKWLPNVRPSFLGMQCGMPIGLARAAIAATIANAKGAITDLAEPIALLESELDSAVTELQTGVDNGRFVSEPVRLFELRIQIADIATQAVQLELQASGGKAYHRHAANGFPRRLSESAFVPVVTPSILQLKGEIRKHQQKQLAALIETETAS